MAVHRKSDRAAALSKLKREAQPIGEGKLIAVRIQFSQMSVLDSWIANQPDQPSRPEAIRRLVKRALTRTTDRRPTIKGTARKASQLASREIEGLVDKSQPATEQRRRKRRLIRGPKEFRNIRDDSSDQASYLKESATRVRNAVTFPFSTLMSILVTSATRRSRREAAAVSTALRPASSHDFSLTPTTSTIR
jgi:hypothetical protein